MRDSRDAHVLPKCQYHLLPDMAARGEVEECGALGVRRETDTIPSLVLCLKHASMYEETKMGTIVDIRKHLT